MGWFEEQIKQRQISDERAFSETFSRIAASVTGDRSYISQLDDAGQAKSAMEQILRWYHITPKDVPDQITDLNEQIEYLTRPNGIMRREVELTGPWWRDAIGPMLGFLKDDNVPVALLPGKLYGYSFQDPKTGKTIHLDKSSAELLLPRGVCFYKPFPLKSMTVRDLLVYTWSTRSLSDNTAYLGLLAIASGLGVIATRASYLLMGKILNSGNMNALVGIAAFLIGLSICQTLNSVTTSIISERIRTRQDIQVRAAVMMRILSLPASFFKKYSSGELASRSGYIQALLDMIFSSAYGAILNSLFSLIYITQILHYAPSLLIPAALVILASIVVYILTTLTQLQISRERMRLSARESGMSFAMISGIQKIRLSGSEKRFFSRWGNLYSEVLGLTYNPPMFLKSSSVISSAIGLAGTLLIYRAAIAHHISYQEYFAFNTAYGMVFSAFMGITGIAASLAGIQPIIEMIDPILKEEPETSEGREYLSSLSGAIEVTNLSFRYEANRPYVLRDLSFKVRAGQYIAIVGKSGCGKSTLVRLLLGFEKPVSGGIFYDGKDIATIDMKSLRQKIGTVTQDGKLFSGSIYENIVISAPWLSMDDAWEAAEIAGLGDDIRRLPMGMHTVISEGSGGFSGGQKQRMMIARAIAPKPKILIFDEATSALDNITQKKVIEALDALKCTRIMIAHRLSTIKHCDRIIVLDGGKIIEDGTYEQLIAKNGFFADLVSRQMIDEDSE